MTSFARTTLALACLASAARADDWPQWLGPARDGEWRETGILEKFPPGGPQVLWRTPIGGGYAGPAVADGRVYVTDRPDAKTERVLCLDEKDGRVLWKHEYGCAYAISYSAGPRTTPVVTKDRVYTLGAMGDLFCLDRADGKAVWSKSFMKDYGQAAPIWGWSGHPLLDGDRLICLVGGAGTAVVAFHKETGKELWRALSSQGRHGPGYAPPVIVEAGGKRQLIAWTASAVGSLDPETGKEYWSHPFPLKEGLSVAMPRLSGDGLFVTAFYDGPLMLKLAADAPAASVAWKGKSSSEMKTDGLHSIIPTPVIRDGHIYGVCSYGQLRCLKAETGERLWETFQATTGDRPIRWANAFLIPNGDRFFIANEKGDLILARLTPKGYEEIDRARLLQATGRAGAGRRPDEVLWSHPAFANRCIVARNDREIIRASLAAEGK
ncbi:MAG TPA: PQQ-binding-like beta-propeller repeat protein [Planctomycetota bacterium]|nr:PQQ-binding-like beta-propeller repeat protein [Planctomycetota bacterium]